MRQAELNGDTDTLPRIWLVDPIPGVQLHSSLCWAGVCQEGIEYTPTAVLITEITVGLFLSRWK